MGAAPPKSLFSKNNPGKTTVLAVLPGLFVICDICFVSVFYNRCSSIGLIGFASFVCLFDDFTNKLVVVVDKFYFFYIFWI